MKSNLRQRILTMTTCLVLVLVMISFLVNDYIFIYNADRQQMVFNRFLRLIMSSSWLMALMNRQMKQLLLKEGARLALSPVLESMIALVIIGMCFYFKGSYPQYDFTPIEPLIWLLAVIIQVNILQALIDVKQHPWLYSVPALLLAFGLSLGTIILFPNLETINDAWLIKISPTVLPTYWGVYYLFSCRVAFNFKKILNFSRDYVSIQTFLMLASLILILYSILFDYQNIYVLYSAFALFTTMAYVLLINFSRIYQDMVKDFMLVTSKRMYFILILLPVASLLTEKITFYLTAYTVPYFIVGVILMWFVSLLITEIVAAVIKSVQKVVASHSY